MVSVLEHGILYRHGRFHAAFPSLLRFGDGNLLLAFRRARDGVWLLNEEQRKELDPFAAVDHIDSRSHIQLQELDPTGKQPIGEADTLPADPEAGDQDPSLLLLPQDQVFLASFSWYPLPGAIDPLFTNATAPTKQAGPRFLFWGSHGSLRGRQSGRWLHHHNYLPAREGSGRTLSPDGSKQVVGAIRGQPLWRHGEVLVSAYNGAKQGCALYASDDRGRHWQLRGLISHDPSEQVSYQEPALCEDGNGGMICFMRTQGADGRLATTRSLDGEQWEPPRLHRLVGHPFHPLLLRDGRVLLSYGYRRSPFGIRVRLLDHPLQDPDQVPEVIVRDDGLCPDLGYPWAVELEDGRILLSYYWTDSTGCRHIAASWLALG